jgi:hypothetical protein
VPEGGELGNFQPCRQGLAEPFLEGGASRLRPSLIVVNVNAPMPAGPTHVDVPDFHGATREQYPHRVLAAMLSSMALLKDGQALIAGGQDSSGTSLDSAELCNPKSGRFARPAT